MTDKAAGPDGSVLSERLGLLAAKRGELRAGANIAVWGCIVCSNVWSASDGGPLKFLLSAIWIMLAGLILWIERDARKA